MKKKNLIFLLSGVLAVGAGSLLASRSTKHLALHADECTHDGYHYATKAATESDPGWFEFWTCCECHEYFTTEPQVGSFADSDTIFSGDVPSEVVMPAKTSYYAKGSQIGSNGVFSPNLQSLPTVNQALSFDFWMKENGSTGFAILDNTWANVTGNIIFTKTSEGVTVNKGTVTAKENNWYNYTLKFVEFDGDGLDRAVDVTLVSGLWDPSAGATAYSEVALAVNWGSCQLVDAGRRLVTGNNTSTKLGYSISREDLTGKALSFDAFFGATGEQTIKVGLYYNSWTAGFIPDLFLTKSATGEYSFKQIEKEIAIQTTDLGDGWVNVVANSLHFTYGDCDYADYVVVWASPTTSSNGVDLLSLKAVDQFAEPYTFNHGGFAAYGAPIATADLIKAGAVSFNVKMPASSAVNLSFMDSDWANAGTFHFSSDANGVITIKDRTDRVSRGLVTALDDGWYNVVINESELEGDGRARGCSSITHWYVENGSITVDLAATKLVARHAVTGSEYAAGQAIDFASWTTDNNNFSYLRTTAQFLNEHAGIGFDIKLVGDGSIDLSLIGDDNDWSNLSGSFKITKSGNEVTCSYANSKVIARADGWVSVFVFAPWPGDGFEREAWTCFAHVYSAGASGTSVFLDRCSFHLVNSLTMPQ